MADAIHDEKIPAARAPTRWRDTRRWFWIIPAATFVVGLMLGTVLVAPAGTGTHGGAGPGGAGGVTGRQPTPAPVASGQVVIPASCEEGLARARAALNTAQQAGDALRDLDTPRLQRLLEQLRGAQHDVDQLAKQCHDAAAQQKTG
jgi:hypothetical protein